MSEIPKDIMLAAYDCARGIYLNTDDAGVPYLTGDDIEEIGKAILAERNSHASLTQELNRLREENERLATGIAELWQLRRESEGRLMDALRPFAAVAKHDIGADETSSDFFQPMEKNNHADRLRVGHFRQAFNTFSLGGDVDDL